MLEAQKSWTILYENYRDFVSCDDGFLAEAYSDAVVNLFANDWDKLPEFAVLAKKYPKFKKWSLSHIDASASEDYLEKIVYNSKRCDKNKKLEILCGEIKIAARHALNK